MAADADCRPADAPPRKLPGGPGAYSFFLDVDGTLADIAETPDAARIEPATREIVEALQCRSGGAVALVSGRAIASVDRMFAPLTLPAAGQHGAERRDAAGVLHLHPHGEAQLETLRRCIAGWASGVAGLLVEDKGMSVAVHFRLAPQLGPMVHSHLQDCLRRLATTAFQAQPGRMVVEVRPAGQDKGRAILAFSSERPYAGRIPVFVGDDMTDEYGFTVINGLGGLAVKVGAGPSVARWRLADVVAVRHWLAGIAEGERT